jgi:dihydroxyacetone kinase DhaKLM complex PTS-EIIA-like component DhaM
MNTPQAHALVDAIVPARERQGGVLICNAPVVDGAVIAATEAWDGSELATVKRMAKELNHTKSTDPRDG